MKFNASAFCIPLVCGSLLLSLSAPAAQNNKSRRHRPATVQKATPKPTPTPAPSLEGTYILIDSDAPGIVNKAIEAAVKGMWAFQDDARNELKKSNLPPPQRITISSTATSVTIETDVAGPVQTALDGTTTTKWSWKGTTYNVSTKRQDNVMVRNFKGDNRWRVNTYSLSDQGKTLNLAVQANGKKFGIGPKRDLVYTLHYKRT